jgi:hypothetical protein
MNNAAPQHHKYSSQLEEKCMQKLLEFSGKSNLRITKRCNEAILMALKTAKQAKKTKLFIPESGGFLTYEQFGKKLGFEIIFVPTENEVLSSEFLAQHLDAQSVLLYHRLAGYHTLLPGEKYALIAQNACALCIEDICGCVGIIKPYGDVIVCSFGNAKPLLVGEGGFIASNDSAYTLLESEFNPDDSFFLRLDAAILKLRYRYEFFSQKRDLVLDELKKLRTQKKITCTPLADTYASTIIAPFLTEDEKDILMKLAEELKIEVTLCPRYIRHKNPAISFEIKRLCNE